MSELKAVTIYVSTGDLSCVDVPDGHPPVHIVDTATGESAWFEQGHTDDAMSKLNAPSNESWQFATTEERDHFLRARFPDRQADDTPGYFKVPGGGVGVLMNQVTFYPEGAK